MTELKDYSQERVLLGRQEMVTVQVLTDLMEGGSGNLYPLNSSSQSLYVRLWMKGLCGPE